MTNYKSWSETYPPAWARLETTQDLEAKEAFDWRWARRLRNRDCVIYGDIALHTVLKRIPWNHRKPTRKQNYYTINGVEHSLTWLLPDPWTPKWKYKSWYRRYRQEGRGTNG